MLAPSTRVCYHCLPAIPPCQQDHTCSRLADVSRSRQCRSPNYPSSNFKSWKPSGPADPPPSAEIQESFPARKRPAYTTVQTMVYRLEVKSRFAA